MMARVIPLVVVLLFVLVATPHAQMVSLNRIFGRYQQFQWREQDGLPQNTVLAITTTRDGYLWVGTYEGLARFDGARFTVFNPANTTAIGNSFVTSMLEDHAGNLWISTWGGGLTRLSEGRFTRYTITTDSPPISSAVSSRTRPELCGLAPKAAARSVFATAGSQRTRATSAFRATSFARLSTTATAVCW